MCPTAERMELEVTYITTTGYDTNDEYIQLARKRIEEMKAVT